MLASLNYEDIYKMPGDVSFLIDEMLRRSADKNSPFYRKIDQSRIGAAGTSLGANCHSHDPLSNLASVILASHLQ